MVRFRLLPHLTRRHSLPFWLALTFAAPFVLESIWHRQRFDVARPAHDLDPPFYSSCQEPPPAEEGRLPGAGGKFRQVGGENAALVMLARNADVEAANRSIASIERKFNRWFHYPIIFLNDEPWDDEFVRVLNATASGNAVFEQIPAGFWGFPDWIDKDKAKASMAEQGARHIHYAGKESYHHMCRFYSGKFYQLEALRNYKWYWRIEPDVEFLCDITYDPFAEMTRRGKTYGFTIALYEESDTCPSLFRKTADWKETQRVPTSEVWKAAVSASWVPYPLRSLMSWLPQRDRFGDRWSLCHYWSNFEIADLEFFRSKKYQEYYEYLDKTGGFYFERWGDAAVHALAVAMYLSPSQVHHFEDLGYRHDELYQCPANAPGGQLPGSSALGGGYTWAEERPGGVGCRCECDGRKTRNHAGYCLNKLKQPTKRERYWFTWFL